MTRAGFTLVEMLVCVGVVALLAGLAGTGLTYAMGLARASVCRSNLHQLTIALRDRPTSGPAAQMLPQADLWLSRITNQGLTNLLHCPEDTHAPTISPELRHVYLRQDGGTDSLQTGVYYTSLTELLAGNGSDDGQVHTYYQGQGSGSANVLLKEPVEGMPGFWRTVRQDVGWQWVFDLNGGNPPADNQMMVAINTCAAFLVTLEEGRTEIRPLGHHPQWNSGSRHWVCKGTPDDANGWRGDVLAHLTGVDNDVVAEPVEIVTTPTSYAMSRQTDPMASYPDQLWLVEYSDSVADFSGQRNDRPLDGDLYNGEIAARHRRRVNIARVDGSVRATLPEDLLAIDPPGPLAGR